MGINRSGIMTPAHGACSSMAEYLTVDQAVVGSTPIRHPKETPYWGVSFINCYPQQGIAWVRPPHCPRQGIKNPLLFSGWEHFLSKLSPFMKFIIHFHK